MTTDASARSRQVLWLIIAAIILRMIAALTTPLIDDEAYYWLWARHLDWSYLDHPPMVAYMLALTTQFGSGALWIRLGPLVLGVATTYALYVLGRDLFSHRAGLIAAALFQVVPVLAGSGMLATPDAPLFLAWTVGLRLTWQAMHDAPRRWLFAGMVLGLGMLSKLYMIFFAIGVIVFVAIYARRWLLRGEPYVAVVLAIVLFSPVIYWNVAHRWAMVDFISHGRLPGTPTGLAGIVEILVQQFAFALLLAPALLYALYAAWRRQGDERYAYLFWTAAPTYAATVALAAISGAPHGNWMGPSYLGLTIVLGALWNRTLLVLAAISGVVLAFGLIAPFVSMLPPPPGSEEIYGWQEAAARLEQERAALSSQVGIVADRYQVAAQLSYYTGATMPATLLPCPPPASIWARGEALTGEDAIAIVDARWTPRVRWEQFAARVEEASPLTVTWHGSILRTFRIWRLHQVAVPSACPSK